MRRQAAGSTLTSTGGSAVTTHQSIVQLAEEQLPAAAMLGLGDELAAVDDALHEEERVIRVATAHDGDAFGVLALTDRRVLWAAAGLASGTIVLAWPRERVRVASADDGGPCIEVNDERWQFSRILPADAVDELADQLSDCGTAGAAVALAAE
jgi:hypothetical protein